MIAAVVVEIDVSHCNCTVDEGGIGKNTPVVVHNHFNLGITTTHNLNEQV